MARFGKLTPCGMIAMAIGLASSALVQSQAAVSHPPVLITKTINDKELIALPGNVRPEVAVATDLGMADSNVKLEHMLLLLQRSPQQEAALEQFIDELHNPSSANFHKWITAQQFGAQFGLAQQDLDTITNWLTSRGFTVNTIYDNHILIDFSGNPDLVKKAFHTEIHNVEVNGVQHIANMTDPQIPAALAPAIKGVVSLNDFMPHMQSTAKTRPAYDTGSTNFPYAIVPGDLATIYNFNPLFSAGISGQGQTIVLIEDTYISNLGDWSLFRKTFGLSRKYSLGTITQVSPAPVAGGSACAVPAVNGDEGEAEIDVQWASAAAPNAAIVLAACADTRTTFGGLIALQNLLTGANTINGSTAVPQVVSISYGESESENGATANAVYSSTYQQAVAEGVSVFVSSGDEGAASSDANAARGYAIHGITVSGFTSTPYNISVGGTDFEDTYFNNSSNYWSATNGVYYNSALSYIPEIPWNDSCASSVLSSYYNTYDGTSFTPLTLCNTSPLDTTSYFLNTVAGSGGPSNCATGTPAVAGVASGTCAGWPKPSWQSVYGNPGDGVRDIPDVSLFASNGFWGHYYVVCWSNPTYATDGSAPCTGAPSTWAGFGGTSVSSPIMAGIQALVNQYTGSAWGNSNYVLYKLANTEYGSAGNSACNSSSTTAPASSCTFYDVTYGDNDLPCEADGTHGTFNCYQNGHTHGVLSVSNTSDQPAYGTNVGWDFSTGIGTVNAYNLVMNWLSSGVAPPPVSTPALASKQ